MSQLTNDQAYKNPLGYESVGKLLARFAIPSIVGMVVNALYNMVDQVFIGQGVGFLGIGATTVTMPINTISMAIAMLTGAGAASLAAIRLGEKRREDAERILGTSVTATFLLCALVSVIFAIFQEPLLTLFGATPSIMPYAKEYSSIISLGFPIMATSLTLSHFIRNAGSPKVSMLSMLAGAVFNLIMDPICIFVLDMGVAGAAIATVAAQVLSLSICLWYIIKKSTTMRLKKQHVRVNFNLLGSICAIGFSGFVLQIASVVLQLIMNNTLVHYGDLSGVGGDVALSAMGVVMKVNFIVISVILGLHQGAQPIIGFNKGAGRPDRMKKTYLITVTVATVIAVLGWAVAQLWPGALVSIFGEGTVEFDMFAEKCMRVFMFAMFGNGFQIISANYFQASGQPIKAALLSSSRQILILAPLLLILPTFMGLDGILYAGPISDLSSVVLTGVFIAVELRKLDRQVAQMQLAPAEGNA